VLAGGSFGLDVALYAITFASCLRVNQQQTLRSYVVIRRLQSHQLWHRLRVYIAANTINLEIACILRYLHDGVYSHIKGSSPHHLSDYLAQIDPPNVVAPITDKTWRPQTQLNY
jgi:hypothetical protein